MFKSSSIEQEQREQEQQYYSSDSEGNTGRVQIEQQQETQNEASSGVFGRRFKSSNRGVATPVKGPVEFAASTSKVPTARISRTPGRGFFKKLFRTPGKSAVKKSRDGLVVTPSKEEELGISTGHRRLLTSPKSAVLIRRANSTGSRTDFSGAVISVEHSTNSTDTEASSTVTQKRVNSRLRRSFSSNSPPTATELQEYAMSSSSPHVARRLLAEEDLNTTNKMQPSPNVKSKMEMKEDNPRETTTSGEQHDVDVAMMVSSDSSERQADLIFMSKSSSSSEENMMPRSGFDLMAETNADQTPVTKRHIPMASRGFSIPTPAVNKRTSSGNYNPESNSSLFSRPLRTATESPAIKTSFMNRLETGRRNESEGTLEQVEEDDDAFLPDDFEKPSSISSPRSSQPTTATYLDEQVQRMIDEAKKAAVEEMCKEYDVKMEDLEKSYNDSLLEQGLEWRRETEVEHKRLMDRFRAEKSKVAKYQQELQEASQQLEAYQQKVESLEKTSETNKADDSMVAQELYKDQLQDKITAMQENLTRLQNQEMEFNEMSTKIGSLQQDKETTSRRVEELEKQLKIAQQSSESVQELRDSLLTAEKELDELRERHVLESNREELVILQDEKAAAQRQVEELTERLRVRTESNNDALTRLEEAEDEITRLKAELSNAMQVGQISIEELTLAQTELQNLQSLRTPQKAKSENAAGSPCSEVDILRVDNNKIHEQLKAMGKVLKRYKAERDEIKAKMVQTIEVAVTQTKESMQEKLNDSCERIDELKKQIGDLEESLKKEGEERAKNDVLVRDLKEQFEKEKNELLVSRRTEAEEFESQIQLAQSSSQEERERVEKKQSEYDELHMQMEQMQKLHDEEVELVQREAREETRAELEKEIISLKSQLSTVQSEKDDLAKNISELEETLQAIKTTEEQHKSESDRSLNDMKAAHRKEIDELTAELDLFEAENEANMRKLKESLKEKETVISAMGKQLADAEGRTVESKESEKSLRSEIGALENEMGKLKAQLQAAEDELADQVVLKEKAIEDVANELTTKAQKQFEERNEMYRGLKKKFDEAMSKVSVLERDLRFAKKELDEAKKRHLAREADLKDELAQSKAATVKSEANTARMEKKHRLELQKSKEELEAANSTSQQIQRSLAIVVNEKEKLAAEVVDLKQISEELLVLLENKSEK